jgi:hypothetical protein
MANVSIVQQGNCELNFFHTVAYVGGLVVNAS